MTTPILRTELLQEIKKQKEAIAAARDRLREILDDVESVYDSADDAVEDLDSVIETLSRYV